MPTSASDIRHAHAGVAPVTLRRRARAHTASAANGSAATVMNATPVNVPTQPCHPLMTMAPLLFVSAAGPPQPPPPDPPGEPPVMACTSRWLISCSGTPSLLLRMTPTQSVYG